MKHKVYTATYDYFLILWEKLRRHLDETGEKIVRSKFRFDSGVCFKATVWTERGEGGKE